MRLFEKNQTPLFPEIISSAKLFSVCAPHNIPSRLRLPIQPLPLQLPGMPGSHCPLPHTLYIKFDAFIRPASLITYWSGSPYPSHFNWQEHQGTTVPYPTPYILRTLNIRSNPFIRYPKPCYATLLFGNFNIFAWLFSFSMLFGRKHAFGGNNHWQISQSYR